MLNVSDDFCIDPSVEISIDGGDYVRPDHPSAPRISSRNGGLMEIDINLSFGPRTEIAVRVIDDAGNVGEASVWTRATRPPLVSLNRTLPEVVETGKPYYLSASCQDPDGDEVFIDWYIDGVHAGSGEDLAFVLENGTHRITLNCSDGDIHIEMEFVVVAKGVEAGAEPLDGGKEGSTPFPWAILVIVLIFMAAASFAVFLVLRHRNSGEEEEEEDWEEEGEEEPVRKGRAGGKQETGGRTKKNGEEIQCGICLKKLSRNSRKERCRCGASFHRACASMEGECPECGREIMLPTDGI
jgi:hypothetical protein